MKANVLWKDFIQTHISFMDVKSKYTTYTCNDPEYDLLIVFWNDIIQKHIKNVIIDRIIVYDNDIIFWAEHICLLIEDYRNES